MKRQRRSWTVEKALQTFFEYPYKTIRVFKMYEPGAYAILRRECPDYGKRLDAIKIYKQLTASLNKLETLDEKLYRKFCMTNFGSLPVKDL